MANSNDINSEEQVMQLVEDFYRQLMQDAHIGLYFTEVITLDLDVHLPLIAAFWNAVLFGTGDYRGNPIVKHIALHRKHPLDQAAFDRWLAIWSDTIDARFVGPKAEEAKQKARTMAQLMLIKIESSENPGFII
jgi:hemoglobin